MLSMDIQYTAQANLLQHILAVAQIADKDEALFRVFAMAWVITPSLIAAVSSQSPHTICDIGVNFKCYFQGDGALECLNEALVEDGFGHSPLTHMNAVKFSFLNRNICITSSLVPLLNFPTQRIWE